MGDGLADSPVWSSSTIPVSLSTYAVLVINAMAGDLFRMPDSRSGPAILDREPVVLPSARRKLARKVRNIGR